MDYDYDNKSNMNCNVDGVIPVAFAVPSTTAPDYNPSANAPNYNPSFTAPNYNPSSATPNYNTSPLRNPSVGQFQSAPSYRVAPGQLGSEPSFKIPPAPSMINTDGTLDENQIKQLKSQGYTLGLAKSLGQNNVTFPLRFWIVDNSGSMQNTDGCQMITSNSQAKVRMATCTRWKEIQDTVDYHVQMAGLLKAPTKFRLLNDPGAGVGPQEFGIADKGEAMIRNDMQVAKTTMTKATPMGVTPLAVHIYDIREQIVLIRPQLHAEGRKVAIVLATDGLPTNEYGIGGDREQNEFIDAMRTLEGLPVWIVIRLCTNDNKVVEFYNDLDAQLELSIEVLDDYSGEAQEVYEKNPWLNYTLPLHRMREGGFQNRLFDLLDERAFTRGELRDFCVLMFGADRFDGVPGSEADFPGFLKAVSNMLKKEKSQWNPIKQQVLPLVDVKKMNKIYGDGSCSIM